MADILISGYYGFDNLGDELLLTALLRDLRQVTSESRITVLSACPPATQARHGVKAVPRNKFQAVLRALKQCDLLLSGGGSLLQDGTSSRSLLYYLGLLALAQAMGKDTMVYSQGVGPLLRPWNRALTRAVLSQATAVTIRDETSREMLEALGLRRPMQVTADPVLALPIRPGKGESTQLAWVIHGRYCTPAACKALREAMTELHRQGCTSWLLPFCPGEDTPILETLTPWGRMVPREQLWPRLRRCGVVISMRLHGLILGAKLGAELVSLTCDPKSDAFLEELGRPRGLPLDGLTAVGLVQAVQERRMGARREDGPALARLTARLEGNRQLLQKILTSHS
ncbi:MAG: polysaccharide pyruvyl transferase CsaB [Candidatus Onthomonas sp.]